MKLIPLSRGLSAKIDDEDFERVDQFKWCALSRHGGFCAVTFLPWENGKRKMLYLHRFILGVEGGLPVDHINHNPLDDQKANLRVCTVSQNGMNRTGATVKSKSGVRGVHWHAKWKKWRATIYVNKKNICLGAYDSKEDAGAAHAAARKKYFGEFAGGS